MASFLTDAPFGEKGLDQVPLHALWSDSFFHVCKAAVCPSPAVVPVNTNRSSPSLPAQRAVEVEQPAGQSAPPPSFTMPAAKLVAWGVGVGRVRTEQKRFRGP